MLSSRHDPDSGGFRRIQDFVFFQVREMGEREREEKVSSPVLTTLVPQLSSILSSSLILISFLFSSSSSLLR